MNRLAVLLGIRSYIPNKPHQHKDVNPSSIQTSLLHTTNASRVLDPNWVPRRLRNVDHYQRLGQLCSCGQILGPNPPGFLSRQESSVVLQLGYSYSYRRSHPNISHASIEIATIA
jgi:hypothetical protein